ncbi:unnamed protein product, partial [Urochloa humidicola]
TAQPACVAEQEEQGRCAEPVLPCGVKEDRGRCSRAGPLYGRRPRGSSEAP